MPCGCFGKHKKKLKEDTTQKIPPDQTKADQSNANSDNGATKNTEKNDVVASYPEDECALLGYRPASSRPPSYVDSPLTNSHTHTPSTLPVATSSNSSQATSSSSSPTMSRAAASSRAELAERRREFFKDFLPKDENSFRYDDGLSLTLPTVARARQFGQVRPMRPISQPSSPSETLIPEPPPPGPHLLRPSSARRSPTKIDSIHTTETLGFGSAEFLRELKTASEEISRRWAQSEYEFDDEIATNHYNNFKTISNLGDHDIQCANNNNNNTNNTTTTTTTTTNNNNNNNNNNRHLTINSTSELLSPKSSSEYSASHSVDTPLSLKNSFEVPSLNESSQNLSYDKEVHICGEEVAANHKDPYFGAGVASSNESLSAGSNSDFDNNLIRKDMESYEKSHLKSYESTSVRIDYPDELSETDFLVQDVGLSEKVEKLSPIIELGSSASSSSPSEHGEDVPLVDEDTPDTQSKEITGEEE